MSDLVLQWVPLRYANGIINAWHSHLPPLRFGTIFQLAALSGPDCVGVVVVSRPTARMLSQDGLTAEVVRLCTNGHPNAASRLLGRARRACQQMGFRRLVSYTLEGEDGTSYQAAGWQQTGRTAPRSWVTKGEWQRNDGRTYTRKRRADHVAGQAKIRWEAEL